LVTRTLVKTGFAGGVDGEEPLPQPLTIDENTNTDTKRQPAGLGMGNDPSGNRGSLVDSMPERQQQPMERAYIHASAILIN
jgi:hypothetical protein